MLAERINLTALVLIEKTMSNKNEEISLKIPAYLRGELSPAVEIKIEELAASDANFSAEIDFQRNLSTALKSEACEFTPGDMGWARLSKDMKSTSSGLITQENNKNSSSRIWKYAAACFAVAAVGQAGVLGNMAVSGSDEDARYIPVSEAVIPTNVITVGVMREARNDDFTRLLIETKGQIVKGPSTLGFYEVQFKSRSECQAAVSKFETQSNVIETASSCS